MLLFFFFPTLLSLVIPNLEIPFLLLLFSENHFPRNPETGTEHLLRWRYQSNPPYRQLPFLVVHVFRGNLEPQILGDSSTYICVLDGFILAVGRKTVNVYHW